jgi:hypothetical protein
MIEPDQHIPTLIVKSFPDVSPGVELERGESLLGTLFGAPLYIIYFALYIL